MAMFIKLLLMRMVARRYLGYSISATIRLSEGVSPSLSSPKSVFVNEKKATSLPEISPDEIISNTNAISDIITPGVNSVASIMLSMGSGSNFPLYIKKLER